MKFYFSPLDKACKSQTGAIARASEVTFNVYKKEGGEDFFSAEICNFLYYRDGEVPELLPMKNTEFGWTITLRFNRIGLYYYCFRLGNEYLGCGDLRQGTESDHPRCWQLTVFDENFSTPEWFKGGIMYQIFPDRFCKSGDIPIAENKIFRSDWGGTPRFRPNEYGKVLNNDFFGGNFNGVREKLGYLSGLGVTVIYFNPIFKAYSNHRYDTGDYMQIDPLLGTEEDFDALVAEAKEKGIRIVLDGVFNHTGDDSRYFNKYGRYDEVGAYQSTHSPYADWYCFREFPDRYESWWGIETLPAVNEASASYQEFIFGEKGVLKNWLRHGIGGYRLDVADELPAFFLKNLRKAVKEEDPEAVIIGEVWEDASEKIAYGERRTYLQGYELDSVMNYPLKDAIISYMLTENTNQLRNTIAMLIDNYPKKVLDCLMNILGTHDTPRILTVLGNQICTNKEQMAITRMNEEQRSRAKKKLKIAAVLQFMLPGVPCIYYGDENAMEGYSDPFCRACFDWNHLDEDLGAFYRKLGDIRKNALSDVLRDGIYREVFADARCLVFERKSENRSAFVYVNNSPNEYSVTLKKRYRECFTNCVLEKKLEIKAYSYGIFSEAK